MKTRAVRARRLGMTDNLYNAMGAVARVSPLAVALETEQGEQFTYAAFDDWTARYAAWLRAIGVRPGERVLVQADKSAQLLMLCYGVIRAGAVFVPLNIGARKREMAHVFADCEPALVVCDPRRAEI